MGFIKVDNEWTTKDDDKEVVPTHNTTIEVEASNTDEDFLLLSILFLFPSLISCCWLAWI